MSPVGRFIYFHSLCGTPLHRGSSLPAVTVPRNGVWLFTVTWDIPQTVQPLTDTTTFYLKDYEVQQNFIFT